MLKSATNGRGSKIEDLRHSRSEKSGRANRKQKSKPQMLKSATNGRGSKILRHSRSENRDALTENKKANLKC